MNLKRSMITGLLPLGMILAQNALANPIALFGTATGALKNAVDIGNTANSGGQQTFVDDLSYKSFAVDLVPSSFDERRLGEWHESKIVCRIRVRDPGLGTAVSVTNSFAQETGRVWNGFTSWLMGKAPQETIEARPVRTRRESEGVGELEGTYKENPEGLPSLYFAEYLYKISVRWNGRVLWDDKGEKPDEAMQLLGQISMDQQVKNVGAGWDSRIAANSSGRVWNAGSSSKFISRVRMTVRLHWRGASVLNPAGTAEFERGYDIFGNGRVDDQWVLEGSKKGKDSMSEMARKKGVFWTCTDPIETGKY